MSGFAAPAVVVAVFMAVCTASGVSKSYKSKRAAVEIEKNSCPVQITRLFGGLRRHAERRGPKIHDHWRCRCVCVWIIDGVVFSEPPYVASLR